MAWAVVDERSGNQDEGSLKCRGLGVRMRVLLEHVFCVPAFKRRGSDEGFVGLAPRFEILWFCEGKLESFMWKIFGVLAVLCRKSHFGANF